MQIENHILVIGETTIDLPKLPRRATVKVWTVPAEYQPSGYFVSATMTGDTPEIPACKDAVLTGTLTLEADTAEQLKQAQANALQQINENCDKELAALTQTYPVFEISSWPQQITEAKAYAADPATPTPLLSELATARGIELAGLVTKVLEKAAVFSVISGQLIGKRQALETAIDATTTLEELAAVQW